MVLTREDIFLILVLCIVRDFAVNIVANLISNYLSLLIQKVSGVGVVLIVVGMTILCFSSLFMVDIYREKLGFLRLNVFRRPLGCPALGPLSLSGVSTGDNPLDNEEDLHSSKEMTRSCREEAPSTPEQHEIVITVEAKEGDSTRVQEVEEAIQSGHTTRGSRILHRRLKIGRHTSDDDLNLLSSQIAKAMGLAREIDTNCTLQFGSFAFLKYRDGKLKWWRLREEWTPVIYDIRRSPWNIFTGERPKWIIRGSNLEESTLKASTSDEKEEIVIERRRKMANGDEELQCAEPGLIWRSALMFWKGVYICAWNSVPKEDEAIAFNLLSKSRNVTGTYWISVAEDRSTMIAALIVAYSVVERMLGSVIRGKLVAIVQVVSTVIATATTAIGGAVVHSFGWSYAYTVVPFAMVVATVVFKLVWKSTENTSASSSHEERLPEGVTKVNDSLYQLFAPRGEPEIDIILFHGLQAGDYTNAYWKSWMSEDGTMLWPQTLLGEKFPNARILSVSYDSATKLTAGLTERGDLHAIAENYVAIIFSSPEVGVGVNRPVVLVGHSLGGLLLKMFVISASEVKFTYNPKTDAKRIATVDNFLANVWGVFYYSTPYNATTLVDIASKIQGTSEALALLKNVSQESSRLSKDFAVWRTKNEVKAMSLVESLPTDPLIWGVKGMKPTRIVEEGSCINDTDSFYTVLGANHITICQPNDMFQSSFRKLEQFLDQCLAEKVVIKKWSRRGGYLLGRSNIWQDPQHLGVGGT